MVFGINLAGGPSGTSLQDQLFCVTEERNYFQGKYLEQISELAALREQLRKSQNEIQRLRGQVMEQESSHRNINTGGLARDQAPEFAESSYQTPTKHPKGRRRRRSSRNNEEKKVEDALASSDDEEEEHSRHQQNDTSSITSTDDDDNDEHQEEEEEEEEEDEDKEAADIRQSAEKLLQWASYRSSYTRTSVSASASASVNDSVASPTTETPSLLPPEAVPQNIRESTATGVISPTLSQDSGASHPPTNTHHRLHSSVPNSNSEDKVEE